MFSTLNEALAFRRDMHLFITHLYLNVGIALLHMPICHSMEISKYRHRGCFFNVISYDKGQPRWCSGLNVILGLGRARLQVPTQSNENADVLHHLLDYPINDEWQGKLSSN